MPSFDMCVERRCLKRLNCYRYTATPDRIAQSYSDFDFKEDIPCGYFISNLWKEPYEPKRIKAKRGKE